MALTPQRILDVGMGFWPAKVLLSAVELDVFSSLGASSKTSEDRLPGYPGGTRLPRAGRGRADGTVPQHPGESCLPRSAESRLRGRIPRDGERPALPLLG